MGPAGVSRVGELMSTSRDGLLGCLRGLAGLDILAGDQRRLAAEAAEKLAAEVVYVAVIGEFKRGKSSLINALLGDRVLPTGVTPVTAAPTLVRFGEVPRAAVRRLDGTETPIPPSDLSDYITERGNPRNRRGVREVVVELPSPLLRPGLVLADTPGTGSVYAHNTETTSAFLPRVDVALLVLSVDAPLSGAEAELLTAAGGTVARAAICLNKVDLLSPAELREATDFVRSQVAALSGRTPVPVFPVSAREAGTASENGLDAVRRFLAEVAAREREAVVGTRARRVAEGVLSVAEAALSLGLAAAAQPGERARTAREAFAEARDELERDAAEAVTLLLAACRRTQGEVVEPRAAELRRSLPGELLGNPDEQWPEISSRAATAWTSAVQTELSGRIGVALARHGDRLQERVERFVRRAGEAYGVALPAPSDVRDELTLPAIRIETADEPGAVAMGIRQVRRHLPGPLGRSWRESARRDRAAEEADRLAGRLRYAAVQAVDRAARSWVREVEVGWRSLSDSLAAAVARAERAAGDAAQAGTGLTEAEGALAAIRASLRAATSPWDPRGEISRMRLDLDENLRQTERLLGDRGVAAALPGALIDLLPRLRGVAAELDHQLILWEGEPDPGLVRSALPQLSRRVRGVVSDALRMRGSALQLIDEVSRGTREAAEADIRHGLQALDDALASIRQLHVPPEAAGGAAAPPPPPPP